MKLVLTGSSSGIGRALALRLLTRGHNVWGLARSNQDELVASSKGRFLATRCDVAAWESVSAASSAVTETWGHIDALVTCAGIQGAVGRTISLDPKAWTATVRTNLDGTFFAIRAFAPLLAADSRRAKIVCFSGGGATKPRANLSAYGAAKTGVVRLVETIAEEERDRPLDINAIAPGAINTGMTDEILGLGPTVVGEVEYQIALKQKNSGGASVERALDLVEWLLSPASDGISGRLISAPWDPWPTLDQRRDELSSSDIFTLRRIVPGDRSKNWD